MENNHLTVKIVIIIVVAALVIGGLILYFKKYLTDNIMDGGDMRNPDYVACEEEIRTAMDNVEEINYTWQHGSMPLHRMYTLRKDGDTALFSCSIDDGDVRLEVKDEEVDMKYFDEAVSQLKIDENSFIHRLFEKNNPKSGDEETALDADSESLGFRCGGKYSYGESSGGTMLQELAERFDAPG